MTVVLWGLGRLWWALVPLAIALAFVAGTADAQSSGRRVALVIGNSSYQLIPRLANPATDVALRPA